MDKGTRIRNLRQNAGMSQVELADRIGVSKQTLYKYENNIVTNIPSDKIEAIATALRVEPEFIMGWNQRDMHDAFNKIAKDYRQIERLASYTEKLSRLSPENQRTVEILIDALLQQEEKK